MAKRKGKLNGSIVALALTKQEEKAIQDAAAADRRDFSDFVRVTCDTAAAGHGEALGIDENLGRPVEKRIRVGASQARAWGACARRQKILTVWWMRRVVLSAIKYKAAPAPALEGC